jgi:hypothetical protein
MLGRMLLYYDTEADPTHIFDADPDQAFTSMRIRQCTLTLMRIRIELFCADQDQSKANLQLWPTDSNTQG